MYFRPSLRTVAPIDEGTIRYLCTVAPLLSLLSDLPPPPPLPNVQYSIQTVTGFIRGILRGVRYAKSLRVLFLHRRSPSWTTLVLYSRVVFIFNEPTKCVTVGGVLKCTVDHILQEFYTLFLTRLRTYKITSPPQTN